ncbi:hypothetical protein CANARDRAFT_26239 [[Candida] arabinofermentans NRRL YB-2248]|uniref:Uncharacterized protein n=1 Tax=[Candida] arabinofermentans NRRL YB-2248 TaxID=983967 RepID=A0A1E4T8T9_9ASCO|nr:hypothetical protein CANARDRAFT_26239 [[Candida] arabinofermentans NRRL YB-2248]
MCGILYHYSQSGSFEGKVVDIVDIDAVIAKDLASDQSSSSVGTTFDSLIPKILARGSDYCNYLNGKHDNDQFGSFELFSSVLSLRPPLTEQPFIKDDRYIIQFNGELYNDEIDSNGIHSNDILFIYNKLIEYNDDLLKVIGEIHGEFAYCIFDKLRGKVYFGKDSLGKKSLCYTVGGGELIVSSCMPDDSEVKETFIECKNAIVYTYDLQSNEINMLPFNKSDKLPNGYIVSNFESTSQSNDLINILEKELTKSIKSRIETIFPINPSHSKFGVLFSGGIDCTLLTAIAASISSSSGTAIDLLNVSFSNPRTGLKPSETPDRKLALKSWINLQLAYPNVEFNLIECDIPYEEYLKHKPRVIKLIYPNDTEMDLSISIAFYFASRGIGNKVILNPNETNLDNFERIPYHSQCKVLLSGLGADELFGGYTRHERIFTPISNQLKRSLKNKPVVDFNEYDLKQLNIELTDELQLDLDNLHSRNLSRDDKVISTWSKELRYPFLDHDFIKFTTSSIPIDFKTRYIVETGEIIRKFALRQLAKTLKLDWIINEPKRAVQFGSKSAKMEIGTSKLKGTDKIT